MLWKSSLPYRHIISYMDRFNRPPLIVTNHWVDSDAFEYAFGLTLGTINGLSILSSSKMLKTELKANDAWSRE